MAALASLPTSLRLGYGRRPINVACMVVLCLSSLGLALAPNYGVLIALRCIQAAGSASTIAVGAGIIGDISTPAERGGFMGWNSLGPMVSDVGKIISHLFSRVTVS